MLGLILGIILLLVGLYLLGSSLWYKIRCKMSVTATVAISYGQEILTESGSRKKVRFPRYRFQCNNTDYLVIDFNASRNSPHAGNSVTLLCDPKRPDRLWYVPGSLHKDVLWGVAYLFLAFVIAFLFAF